MTNLLNRMEKLKTPNLYSVTLYVSCEAAIVVK